jgi:hypothetical protein
MTLKAPIEARTWGLITQPPTDDDQPGTDALP